MALSQAVSSFRKKDVARLTLAFSQETVQSRFIARNHQEDAAVITRSSRLCVLSLGLWISAQVSGLADNNTSPPIPLPGDSIVLARPSAMTSNNQWMADAIARQLRQSAQLRRYKIDVDFQDGLAELRGHVADAWQREEVIRLVQGVPGVEVVRDRLTVIGFAPVIQTQTVQTPGGIIPGPMPSRVEGPMPQEPAPLYQAPAGAPYGNMQPPRMPPYAWPSTAPYNNYSRVAYPTLHPYEDFPFIGPHYPFPKIPLGWRSVTLEWKDGFWWYGQNATGHDWWRIRYW